MVTSHADTAKNDIRWRVSIFTPDSHRELFESVVNVLRKLRILIQIGQVRSSFILKPRFLCVGYILLRIELLLLLQFSIKVLQVSHLLVLVVHHVEELLRVHFAVSSSSSLS